MAGLIPNSETRGQLAAIARVRWQMVFNSARSMRGRLEIVSRIIMALSMTIVGVGGCTGIAVASWYFASHDETEFLAILLWLVFLFWQLFPVMASAFAENADSSSLLRFPLTYGSYLLVQLAYGSLDPATVVGSLWLGGLAVGVGIALPGLFPWAALVVIIFALLNIFLTRMIFLWVERWLAKRRTRELMGVLFFVIIICCQFIGPVMSRVGDRAHPQFSGFFKLLLPLERLLPPGLAASALSSMEKGSVAPAVAAFTILCGYCAIFLWLLGIRVRRQYLGENLSEAIARATGPKAKSAVREGWDLRGLPGGVAAVFEKDVRYILRSGPMLFQLVMPFVILLIFGVIPTPARNGGQNFLQRLPDFAFPIGAFYALILIVNLSYNLFGADQAGIQFFFVSPVPFRDVILGKNLAITMVLVFEIIACWVAACVIFRVPPLEISLATLAGMLFAVPVNLMVGDVMSFYAPKKVDVAKFGRQGASGLTALASLSAQAISVGLISITFVMAHLIERIWVGILLCLVYACAAFAGYVVLLRNLDALAIKRREDLIDVLCRT